MSFSKDKLLTKTTALGSKLRPFFYGAFYPAYVAAFTVLFYLTDLAVAGLFFYAIAAVFTLILYDDLTPFIPLPITVLALFRNFDAFSNVFTFVPIAIIFLALVAHFIIYPIKKIKKGKLYLPLILVTVALFTGGFFAPYMNNYGKAIVSMSATGPLIMFAYFVFTNYVKPPKKFDLGIYICYVLTLLGLVCFTELCFFAYQRDIRFPAITMTDLGWSNVNSVATLLLIAIPACCYLLVRTERIIPCLIALACMYAGMYLTNSDACMGISIVAVPVLAILIYLKSNCKIRRRLILLGFAGIVIALLACALLFTQSSLVDILTKLFNAMMNDTGRSSMYRNALSLFAKYPVFGAGLHYVPENLWITVDTIFAFNFHSTFFHIIATMGSIGLAAFIFYYVRRYRILLNNSSAFNTFAFMSFTLMEVYGMIDTCEFNIMPIMLTVTILLVAVELSNEKGSGQPLPLRNKILTYSDLSQK